MNYRIETRGAFRIIGVSAPLDKEIENNFMIVPKMWQDPVKCSRGTVAVLLRNINNPFIPTL